jgi:predicted PurR-regulated permease PerM
MAKAVKPREVEPAPPPGPVDLRNTHIWGFQAVRDLLIVAAVVGLFYLGHAMRVVTVPLLVALLLAYLFEPLVRWMTRPRWVSRQGAVGAIIVCAALLVVVPVTVGVGFAVVQGISAASAAAEVASDLLRVTRFVDAATGPTPDDREIIDQGEAHASGLRFKFEAPDRAPTPQEPPPDAPVDPDASDPTAGDSNDGDAGESGGGSKTLPRRERTLADEAAAANQAYDSLGRTWRAVADVMIQQRLADRPDPAVPAASGETSAMFRLLDASLTWVQSHAQVIGRQAIGTGAQAVGVVLSTARSLGMLLFGGFLTAFFFFFLSTGFGSVLKFWEGLIPERKKGRAIELLMQMDLVVSGFVRGRLLIALILAVVYTIGYWIVGVPAPLIMGPLVGLVTLIPYVALIGMPVCSLLMALEPSGVEWQMQWWWVLLAPALVYALGQALDDYLLSPIIQGKSTGMDTPTILFASIAGGALAGVYGLLLAIPIAACIKVLLKEIFWPRFRAWAEGRADDMLPIAKE